MIVARSLALAAAAIGFLHLIPATTSTTAIAAPIPAGPAGEAFYKPPSPLPKGPRGSLIRARPLDGTMALPGAKTNTLVLYRSTGAKAESVAVSGTVSIPTGTAPKGGWPVIVWAHGTTGLAPECAPSRDTDKGIEHEYISVIRTLLDSFVTSGYAVVASDYEGLGTPGDHPFLQGVPTGRNALDILRAARELDPSVGKHYAVMGHSQGGQVDLFAAAIGPRYIPEFTLVGNVAFAPGSHIGKRLDSVIASPKVELALPYTLYALGSYAKTNPKVDPKKILTPQALSHMPDLFTGCMTTALTKGYWSTAIAKDQFVKRPDLRAFRKMARENEPGFLRISVPTLMLQGKADVTVLPKDTDEVAKGLCAKGNVVEYRAVAGADHDGVMVKAGTDARAWIDARFKGETIAGNCKALPKAAE